MIFRDAFRRLYLTSSPPLLLPRTGRLQLPLFKAKSVWKEQPDRSVIGTAPLITLVDIIRAGVVVVVTSLSEVSISAAYRCCRWCSFSTLPPTLAILHQDTVVCVIPRRKTPTLAVFDTGSHYQHTTTIAPYLAVYWSKNSIQVPIQASSRFP